MLKRDIQRFLREIKGIYPGVEEQALRWTVLKDKNWSKSWRRFFSPQKIGKHFWITPPWVAPPLFTGRKVITIEPGMAFGTGTHPSTRCCLEFLEEVIKSLRHRSLTGLDVGTGSGILAIALAKMGASEVVAVDNDPVALEAAQSNIRRNRVEKIVQLSNSGIGRIKESFAVVVANLTAGILIDLAPALQKTVASEGYLILSGVLKPQTGEVLRQFSADPFVFLRQVSEKEWTTLLLQRKG